MRVLLALWLFVSIAVAANPNVVLVQNKAGNSISFVNTASMKSEQTVAVGRTPHEMAVSPDGSKAYVANTGENTVSVVDLTTRKELKKLMSDDFSTPHVVAFTPDGRYVFVTSEGRKKIVVIDGTKDEIARAVETDQERTHMVVVSSDSRWAYFTNVTSATVSVFDVTAMKIVANIPAGKGVEGLALSPDGKQLWA